VGVGDTSGETDGVGNLVVGQDAGVTEGSRAKPKERLKFGFDTLSATS
jgi:hypothetical protein